MWGFSGWFFFSFFDGFMEKQLIFLHCFKFSLEASKGLKSCIFYTLVCRDGKMWWIHTKASDLAVLEKGDLRNAPKHCSFSP